jgi:amino acid adenylation domain-containing protein
MLPAAETLSFLVPATDVPAGRRGFGAAGAGLSAMPVSAGGPATWVAAFNALVVRYTQQSSFLLDLTVVTGGGLAPVTTVTAIELGVADTARRALEGAAAALAAIQGSHAGPEAGAPAGGVPSAEGRVALTLLLDPDLAWDPGPSGPGNRGDFAGPELRVILTFRPDGVGEQVVFDRHLFRTETIARLVGHHRVLAEAIRDQPEVAIGQLPMLTPEETRQLEVDWRGPALARASRPLHRHVEDHARRDPYSLALTFRERHLTYDQLNRRANQVARYLLGLGLRPGNRVAVCVEPSFDIAVCMLGIFKAGGVHVPLEPTYPRERLSVILEDTAPSALLTQAGLASGLPATGVPTLTLDRVGATLDAFADHDLDPGEAAVELEQTAFLIYTSGTTGKPKGVMLTHANLVHYVLSARDRYGFGSRDVVPAFARFTFSITLFETLLPLVAGARVIVLERDHVLDFRRLIPTLREATAMHASPSLLRRLLAHVRENGVEPGAFRNLRHVSSGGDLVSGDLMESLKRVFESAELFVIYGCSEISCMGCTFAIPRDRTMSRSVVGKPFENTAVRLYDGQLNLVPVGVPGEIFFSGAGVGRGYLDRDDLTAERFVVIERERFYRTGDLGRFDAEGNLEILGRTDFQIKLRGIRIELGEIESTLRQAPGVREAVVAARELAHREKALVAYLVLDPAGPPDLPGLRRRLQAKLPDYMVPAAYVVLERLPVNINLKVDRRALPLPTEGDLARTRTVSPPRTPVERQLVAIWESVLGTRPIGIRDSFFDVGGNSLLALTLMVRIEAELGRSLPLSTLLTEPTVEQLAALLGADGVVVPSLVLLRPGAADRPPVFFVHDGDGEVLPYRNLALRLHSGHAVYGIRPFGRGAYPMLHTRLSEAVDHYVKVIRRAQPRGPYLLGGLCIGGFLAFEVARRLRAAGEGVGLVALIDAAHVKAAERSVTAIRLGRVAATVGPNGSATGGGRGKLLPLARTLGRKTTNFLAYELKSRRQTTQNSLKMALLRYHLDRGRTLPKMLEGIPVSVVLRFAEREYVVPEPYRGEVVLFRATRKDPAFEGTLVDDTPYVELFVDPLLGWRGRALELRVHDNPGGHSSMLQEPNVIRLAARIQEEIDRALAAREASLTGAVP